MLCDMHHTCLPVTSKTGPLTRNCAASWSDTSGGTATCGLTARAQTVTPQSGRQCYHMHGNAAARHGRKHRTRTAPQALHQCCAACRAVGSARSVAGGPGRARCSALTSTYSCHVPWPVSAYVQGAAVTRSPSFQPATPSPTSSMTPMPAAAPQPACCRACCSLALQWTPGSCRMPSRPAGQGPTLQPGRHDWLVDISMCAVFRRCCQAQVA